MPATPNPEPSPAANLGFTDAHRLLSALLVGTPSITSEAATNTPTNAVSIPGYTLDGLLGRGAGGVVYRAFRAGSDRPVALKLLYRPPGVGPDSPRAQRAWRELSVLSELQLPCLPRVLDYGAHPGGLYISTELIAGEHVDRYCQQKQLPRRQRVELLARIADAVQQLHERGVIHRDLKPSNILITPSGDPVIIDLGLAAILVEGLDPTHTLTTDGAPLGTPAFMSPEQARGERVAQPASLPPGVERDVPAPPQPAVRDTPPHAAASPLPPPDFSGVTTRSDIYSLGATAYVLLTSHTPHDMNASLHEVVRRVAQEPPRDPRALDATLPKSLAAILRRACARESRWRYASATELAEDLRRWVDGETPLAATGGAWQRSVRWAIQHPKIMTLAACVAMVATTVVATRWIVRVELRIPDRIVLAANGTYAALVSRGSFELGPRWGSGKDDSVSSGQLFPTADRSIAAVLFGDTAEPDDARRLKLYDITKPTAALWATDPNASSYTPPQPVENPESECYSAGGFLIEDVVSSPPGEPAEECIVYCRSHNGPWTSIQIRSLASGTILKQFWHRGHLAGPIHWMADAHKLVFCAASNEKKWIDLLGECGPDDLYPRVIFAVDPASIPDGLPAAQVRDRPDPGNSREFAAAWYRCVLPSNHYDLFNFNATRFNEPALPRLRRNSVAVVFPSKGAPRATVEFIIGSDGAVQPGVPAYDAVRLFPQLVNEPLRLGDLPR